MYKIDARIKGVNTFLNKHVSHRARMNFLDHQCLVDGELYRREYLDMMIWVDFNEVQRSINNNPILIGIQRSMTLASFT
ncbi:MAG: hypothetical protein KJ771_02375 [Nanoarchaeota archaeon]|nr:hypothetical protein [Nanoarchaeota archaeon]